MAWFGHHFEPREDSRLTIKDVCDIFKHTKKHEARPTDVIRSLKDNGIEVRKCFKSSQEYWKVPYLCKTHQVLHIGVTDSETHSTDYHTIVDEHRSGVDCGHCQKAVERL